MECAQRKHWSKLQITIQSSLFPQDWGNRGRFGYYRNLEVPQEFPMEGRHIREQENCLAASILGGTQWGWLGEHCCGETPLLRWVWQEHQEYVHLVRSHILLLLSSSVTLCHLSTQTSQESAGKESYNLQSHSPGITKLGIRDRSGAERKWFIISPVVHEVRSGEVYPPAL